MTTWTLLDYGVGNLHSLRKALEAVGATTAVTDDARVAADADIAVLPGVGAFGHVMKSVAPAADRLRSRHEAGRPTLGVCIGLQVMHQWSDEAAGAAGVGIMPGTVKRIPADAGKVPHMGWNTLDCTGPWTDAHGSHVYYVHAYAAPPSASTVATTTYGDTFAAINHDKNTLGFQFHPEKSSTVGRRLLTRARSVLEEAL